MREFFSIFACGFFGGAAPSILELATKAQVGDMPEGGYYFAIALFGIIGGGIAIVYKEVVSHKAFLLGVSAPALIIATGSLADSKVAMDSDFGIMPNAVAQDVVIHDVPGASDDSLVQSVNQGRLVVIPIDPKTFGGKYVESDVRIDFRLPNGSGNARVLNAAELLRLYKVGITISDDSNISYAVVPNDAVSAHLVGNVVTSDGKGVRNVWDFQTTEVELPKDYQSVSLTFQKKQSFWSGFLDAIGMDNIAKRRTKYPAEIEQFVAITDTQVDK